MDTWVVESDNSLDSVIMELPTVNRSSSILRILLIKARTHPRSDSGNTLEVVAWIEASPGLPVAMWITCSGGNGLFKQYPLCSIMLQASGCHSQLLAP